MADMTLSADNVSHIHFISFYLQTPENKMRHSISPTSYFLLLFTDIIQYLLFRCLKKPEILIRAWIHITASVITQHM